MIEMKVAEEYKPDTTLFCQSESRTDRTTVQKHGVVNEESATLLANPPICCIHEAIGPVAPQHSNLHVVMTIVGLWKVRAAANDLPK